MDDFHGDRAVTSYRAHLCVWPVAVLQLCAIGCASDSSEGAGGDWHVSATTGGAGQAMAGIGVGQVGAAGARPAALAGTSAAAGSSGARSASAGNFARPSAAGAGGRGINADAGGSGSPDAGILNPANTDDAGSECEPEASKASQGEACTDDSECKAGLLCGDDNGMPGLCRPIQGLNLMNMFRPAGRLEAAANSGGMGEYSEGLAYAHGFLWQATPYVLHQIDVDNETLIASYPTPSEIDYREGITWSGNTLLQASYRNINIYAAEFLASQRIGAFSVRRQLDALPSADLRATQERRACVYGIVDHCNKLYTTRCGSNKVDIYASGTTGGRVSTFEIRDEGGRPLPAVEDMEIYRGQLWTSTFSGNSLGYDNVLFRIDLSGMQQGVATAIESYEISQCTTRSGAATLSLDGISVNRATRELHVSGKDCPIIVFRVH